ncbi:NAD-dependent epimerase/dehydratase family protein [Sulfitobacter geojensis]|uniref:GDP-mannose 4,6-dehydratase n=1 Tax=Sulfitobacter geojensis TaxID=1342299 RepID=A0AAE2W020_9RHOB|nr:GDP-mannose 4,6-dehydratase [Sulfitobacter geojensis]MBM1694939.1 GDP-mannose 4,6-dehydratase [Sulfitobacter geojensis]MBM1706907.1 GDP-mannose 4,6-dehydratase [Sulfitobacter geojensis]MBM1710965.1 GDP-mannose 4,6-dehydratase [Sulfitobacter geojensis]MBM1715031.1 GDP-mannose 4,6-dehydratase [Sulfitobacter geojensis]
MKTALVTGSSGFVGYFTSLALLDAGWRVVGIDSMSDYYDVTLKQRRQEMLLKHAQFQVVNDKIETPGVLLTLFEQHRPDIVIHLAAQAGVRHSIQMPRAYVEANLMGTFELLEAARTFPPKHMLLASSSSVYGANTKLPYAETDKVDTQMSFYAATKKATENLAHSYAHLYNLPTTMYRFFTVYGPWGRPDMAHFKFTRAILNGDPIDVYNHGKMQRDFTYVDDLVASILALADAIPDPANPVDGDSISPNAPFRVVNIGNDSPVKLLDFIAAIETACGREAIKTFHDIQPGDVPATWADATLLHTLTGQRPVTPIATGIQHFVDWYRDYYKV